MWKLFAISKGMVLLTVFTTVCSMKMCNNPTPSEKEASFEETQTYISNSDEYDKIALFNPDDFVSPSGAEPGTDLYLLELTQAMHPDWTIEQCEEWLFKVNNESSNKNK